MSSAAMSKYVNDMWPGSPQEKASPSTSGSGRSSRLSSRSRSRSSSRSSRRDSRSSSRSSSRSHSRPRRSRRSRSRSRRRHQRKYRRYSRSYSRSRSRSRSHRYQQEEVDVLPESPLSDVGAEDIGTGPKNDNKLTGQESSLGDSPPFEKESEPESPMDVDNSKNSCQDSEADEETSPVFDEQDDRSSQTANKLSSCQAREADGDLRKRYLTKGSEVRLHFQFEGENNAGTSDLNAKPSGNSSSLNVECRSSKQHGKRCVFKR